MTLLYHPSSPGGRQTPAGVAYGPRHHQRRKLERRWSALLLTFIAPARHPLHDAFLKKGYCEAQGPVVKQTIGDLTADTQARPNAGWPSQDEGARLMTLRSPVRIRSPHPSPPNAAQRTTISLLEEVTDLTMRYVFLSSSGPRPLEEVAA